MTLEQDTEGPNTLSIVFGIRPRFIFYVFLDYKSYPKIQIQMLAFNSDLYENFTEAMTQPRGTFSLFIGFFTRQF